MGTKILLVDGRCRITLGTKLVSPGDPFIVSKNADGSIILKPVKIESW